MHFPVLTEIVIIFALSAVVLLVFSRLRIPPIIGFLFTGVIAGPHALGAVTEVEAVEVLAEIGVILLMFTIGLEFSIRDLLRMKKAVLGGGGLQVGLTVAGTVAVALVVGAEAGTGVFFGFLVALSSTAIVLRQLQVNAQTETPHGRMSLGILIFQDVIIVPMMLVTPLLAGTTAGNPVMELLLLLLKGLAALALVIVAGRWVIPPLMHRVAGTRIKELFFLFTVALCFLVAWLTASAGLSLALGAFLAGMILSESDYSLHALGNVLPFRDVFTSFFFVSVGMLLDPVYVLAHPLPVLGMTVAVIAGKAALAALATIVLRYPLRTAILAGLGLAQIGEFSFILSRVGVKHGLLGGPEYQLFLAVSVLTMAMTPVMMSAAPGFADWLERLRRRPSPEVNDPETDRLAVDDREISCEDGLLIIGYGLNGRNLYSATFAAGIPVSIIEMNPETVRTEAARGVPIRFGDASQDAVLLHAGLRDARVTVIAISDPAATARITERIRALHPSVHVIARTRFTSEVPRLFSLGADEVIPEEFETAVEIFARTLRRLDIDEREIVRQVRQLRDDGYAALRKE